MPLHRPEETLIRLIQRFGQTVRGDGHGGQTGSQPADGLVMVAVYRQDVSSETAVQRGVMEDLHIVCGLIIGWALMMIDSRGML